MMIKHRLSLIGIILLSGVLTVGCSDFGQSIGKPQRMPNPDSQAAIFGDLEETGASVVPPEEATNRTREVIAQRDTPWIALTAMAQGAAISADGELDLRNLAAGCQTVESYESSFVEKIQFITRFAYSHNQELPAGVSFQSGRRNYPSMLAIAPQSFAKFAAPGAAPDQATDCRIEQTVTVEGQIQVRNRRDIDPLRSLVLSERTVIKSPEAGYEWKEKRIELRRSISSMTASRQDSYVMRISLTDVANNVRTYEYRFNVRKISTRSVSGRTVNTMRLSLTRLVHHETNAAAPDEVQISDTSTNRAIVVETSRPNATSGLALRYHRPIEPLPAPWAESEEQVLRSIVNAVAYFDGFSF